MQILDWLGNLDFFRKLDRMMAEVSEKFLAPEKIDFTESLPPDLRLVGQLTEAEKRLLGVIRQLEDKLNLEDQAHDVLHSDPQHDTSSCQIYNEKRLLADQFLSVCAAILLETLRGRLPGTENCMFLFDGDNVYAHLDTQVKKLRSDFAMVGQLKGLDSYLSKLTSLDLVDSEPKISH